MTGVFISYRRDDTRGDAGRLYDRLSLEFGADRVFKDVDDILPGEDFVACLNRAIDDCDVVLAMIGPNWARVTDSEGRVRLTAPDDFVRMEIKTAFERDRPVIPVLVGGAVMPAGGDLPGEIQTLSRLQAVELSETRYTHDVDELVESIRRLSRVEREIAANDLRSAPACVAPDEFAVMVLSRGFYDARRNVAGPGPTHAYEIQTVNTDIGVADEATGLVWQRSVSSKSMPFEDTVGYLADLNARRFLDRGSWRLPTLEECMSVVCPEATADKHLDPVFDLSGPGLLFTADDVDEKTRWFLNLFDGCAYTDTAGFNAWVRAVSTL